MYFNKLNNGDFDDIKKEYEDHLFRKNKPSTFKDAKGELFAGYIKAVDDNGCLQVLLEDNITKSFALKDIALLY